MLVFAVADRALDIIGLLTVIYFTVKATRWSMSFLPGRKRG